MTFVALTVLWLAEVVAGVLFFEAFLVLAAGVLQFFPRVSPMAQYAIRQMTEPVVRPARRLTGRLALRFDLAPFLVALLLYAVQIAVIAASQWLAFGLEPRIFYPRAATPVDLLRWPLWAYMFVVLLRVAMTWFGSPEYHPFVLALRRFVDPVLAGIRRVLPRRRGLDWAPMVLLALLWFLDRVVVESIALAFAGKGVSG